MDRKIHRALDGDIPVAELTPAQQDELAALQSTIAAAVASERSTEPAPDVAGAVMWRIAHLEQERKERRGWIAHALSWLLTPRTLSVRPAAALAAAVVLAVGVPAGAALLKAGAGPVTIAQEPQLLIQFRLGAEGARDVALIGDFTGWEGRYELEEVSPGVWSTIVSLKPGVYDYAFVIDGETWALDPLAPSFSDGFGGANNRVAVLSPEYSGSGL
jgi:hypothetical protein